MREEAEAPGDAPVQSHGREASGSRDGASPRGNLALAPASAESVYFSPLDVA